MLAIIIFVIILSILVILHELGHFIMAKRASIGVEEFGIGLPPRIFGKKIGETIYSVNWLPFGGFVKLVGEDPTDKRREQANSFYTKTIRERASVVVAGVLVNFILAIIIFYIVLFALNFKVSLPSLFEHQFKFVDQSKQVLVIEVGRDSPAQTAGIKPGESIIRVNGTEIGSRDQLQGIIRSAEGRDLTLTLENPSNNQIREVVARPVYNQTLGAPALGVGLGELVTLNYQTLPQKVFSGLIHSYNILDYSIRIFGQLVSSAIQQKDITPVAEGVSGPVGIARITQEAVALGAISVLQLAGLLSLNLAFINVLPIPALDGGRFFFIIIEAVTRRRVHASFEKWAHSIGFAFLLALIILVTYNDILKLIR